MTNTDVRLNAIALIEEAITNGARQAPACAVLGIDTRTYRRWVHQFVEWYNHEHRHSGIKFFIPAQRHAGLDLTILAERKRDYEAAKESIPARWSGKTRNWDPITVVHPNRKKDEDVQVLMVV